MKPETFEKAYNLKFVKELCQSFIEKSESAKIRLHKHNDQYGTAALSRLHHLFHQVPTGADAHPISRLQKGVQELEAEMQKRLQYLVDDEIEELQKQFENLKDE